MRTIEYLGVEDLLGLVQLLGAGPVRDLGQLEAAAVRPRARPLGEDAYPSLALKAAAFLQSLATGDALASGNGRLAWLATTVFLDLNGHAPSLGPQEAVDLVEGAASSRVALRAIAERLRSEPRRGD